MKQAAKGGVNPKYQAVQRLIGRLLQLQRREESSIEVDKTLGRLEIKNPAGFGVPNYSEVGHLDCFALGYIDMTSG